MPDPLAKAACKGREGYDWYANTVSEMNRAISVCRICPVSKACCEEADRRKEQWGIWGGISRPSKSGVRKRQRAAMEIIWETGEQPIDLIRKRRPPVVPTTPQNVVDLHSGRRQRAAEGYE